MEILSSHNMDGPVASLTASQSFEMLASTTLSAFSFSILISSANSPGCNALNKFIDSLYVLFYLYNLFQFLTF